MKIVAALFIVCLLAAKSVDCNGCRLYLDDENVPDGTSTVMYWGNSKSGYCEQFGWFENLCFQHDCVLDNAVIMVTNNSGFDWYRQCSDGTWLILYNGSTSTVTIDNTVLKCGDKIEIAYHIIVATHSEKIAVIKFTCADTCPWIMPVEEEL